LSKYVELLTILREQSETVSLLIQLASAERRAIAERDVSALSSVASQEAALAERLRILEIRRQAAVRALSSAPDDDTATLRDLLNGASTTTALQVKSIATRIPVNLARSGMAYRASAQLVRSALGLDVSRADDSPISAPTDVAIGAH